MVRSSVSRDSSFSRLLRTAGLSLLALLLAAGGTTGDQARSSALSRAERDFLERHWKRPIPPQGTPPADFTEVDRSLAPESCGVCHPAPLADWKTSLHARAMGPGVAGQLVEMVRTDPESARECLSCHAPLAEQQPQIAGPKGVASNPHFDAALQRQGLVCAACHVRRHERFGPPRRGGSLVTEAPRASLPHSGVTRTPAFLRSEFCSSCHQFPPDGFALNGKLLAGWHWGLSITGPSRSLAEAALLAGSDPIGWGGAMLIGIPLGSWVSARLRGPVAWQAPAASELPRRFVGGLLMGAGGTLASGCNIGNALTGLSVLSVQSLIASAGMVVGALLAIRMLDRRGADAE